MFVVINKAAKLVIISELRCFYFGFSEIIVNHFTKSLSLLPNEKRFFSHSIFVIVFVFF